MSELLEASRPILWAGSRPPVAEGIVEPVILEFGDFERILAETLPLVGNSNWAVNLARWSQARGRHSQRHVQSLFKRAMNNKRPYFIFEAGGLKFVGDRRDRYARTIAAAPSYEDASVGYILQSLRANPGAYLDVGTNMGVVAALVAKKIDQQVIAVEPHLLTAKRAASAFALNGLRNVTLHVAAVGDHQGEVAFYSTPGSSDASSLSGVNAGVMATKTTVPLVTIDSIVEDKGIDRVGFIKIDVEGFEPLAIKGASETIKRDQPDLFFEYHFDIAPKLGWTAEEVRDQVEALARYKYSIVHENDPVREFPPTRDMGVNVNVWCRRA